MFFDFIFTVSTSHSEVVVGLPLTASFASIVLTAHTKVTVLGFLETVSLKVSASALLTAFSKRVV